MKIYTLKLKTTSTTNYNLYDGTTLVSDSDLGTLFGSAGEAYFTFDFNSLTPTNITSLTILNSQDTAVITNTGLSGITENKNFKGTWSASATAFDSFTLLSGVAMDEAQLSKLVGVAKDGKIKTLTRADYNYPTNNPTTVALWLVDTGVYIAPNGVKVRCNNLMGDSEVGGIYIVNTVRGSGTTKNILFSNWVNSSQWFIANSSGGSEMSGGVSSSRQILLGYDVKDTLTDTSTLAPLSANQGKVLNGKIGDLTTLTTTAKTSAVAAINELDSIKAEITMATIDPGEGTLLAENHLLGIYSTN